MEKIGTRLLLSLRNFGLSENINGILLAFGELKFMRSGGRDGVHKFFSKIYSLAILKIFVNSLSLINKNY